ncbi:UNVERIFIED_CONTAM: hypothetical protein PYX00_007922 [Menopon gallinae]|uniref:Cytochrome c oxidase assembly protein COX11, mitochondrial n=1 Tax=Menopon gallinae TaxID=328185 RepID=A0AAW2HMB0_9NEOP
MNRVKISCDLARRLFFCSRNPSVNSLHYVQKSLNNRWCEFHNKSNRPTVYDKNISGGRGPKTTRNYLLALTIMTLGLSYAAVPLYGIFCKMTGYGGTTRHESDEEVLKALKRDPSRKITIRFNSDVDSSLAWNFRPAQTTLQVVPGETVLAFYTASNPTDKPIVGVSTYNVLPFEAGPHFNKIQCFCFEEQMLDPHETVDMPVFFYIDPKFCDDPTMEFVDEIVLSYTFFEAKEKMNLPIPSFLKQS